MTAALTDYLAALEATRPFLRGRSRPRRSLRGRWYRDSLDLAWACVHALEHGPGHFQHLSFAPPSLRAALERLQELQVARDAALGLLEDAEAELAAAKGDVACRTSEVVASIRSRLADPQRPAHAGLSALAARVGEILGRRGERLRGRGRAAAARAEGAALRAENERLAQEIRRLAGGPDRALQEKSSTDP